jgi:hypothetical protein
LNVGKITSLGYIIIFDERQCLVIRRKDHQVIMRGIQDGFNGFYHLDMKTLIESSQVNAIDNSFDVRIWHCKLGHLNYRGLKFLFDHEMATWILVTYLQLKKCAKAREVDSKVFSQEPNMSDKIN